MKTLYGAICGDVIGSTYEVLGTRTKDFNFDLFTDHSRPTDDTVCTIALAYWMQRSDNHSIEDCQESLRYWGKKCPGFGYGPMYRTWLDSDNPRPYNSYGNGSAMRVSPCALVENSLDDCLGLVTLGTVCTHNHPEGLIGAWAIAECCWRCLHKEPDQPEEEFKKNLRKLIQLKYGYDLKPSLKEIRQFYFFDCTCQGSVPQAITAFLESSSYEEAVRNAVSLGGDSDTLGAMTGSIAACLWDIPEEIIENTKKVLPKELIDYVEEFDKYINKEIK